MIDAGREMIRCELCRKFSESVYYLICRMMSIVQCDECAMSYISTQRSSLVGLLYVKVGSNEADKHSRLNNTEMRRANIKTNHSMIFPPNHFRRPMRTTASSRFGDYVNVSKRKAEKICSHKHQTNNQQSHQHESASSSCSHSSMERILWRNGVIEALHGSDAHSSGASSMDLFRD
jgi:hypothetical protein